MIVKNESNIIANTLEKLCGKIHFDYWIICDTGSTDNTPQIITDFFHKKGIKGELFYDEWVNFAHNRTLALQRAFKKTQLLLVFDADDEIVGNITMPTEVLFDQYHLKFGSSQGTVYTRVLLINNYKKFEYLSVIHEFISCKEEPTTASTINGDYYVVSGRTGSRSLDPNKYLKDALILEKAYTEAKEKNDNLFHRYAYYCANSYKDYGNFEDAIKWYKITLSHPNQWNQEKYTSCLYIYDCYKSLNQEFNGYFYLVKSFAYDTERVECLYHLLVHYCCENMNTVAYNYYLNVKDFFENHYLNIDISQKLFAISDKYNFFVPYYMILIADKVQDFKCVIRMYEIVFIKKQMVGEWYIKNFLYNLQFFIIHIHPDNKNTFVSLANEYCDFLHKNGINLSSFDFLNKDVYKNAGLNFDKYIIKPFTYKEQKFTKNECASSKNILFYTGFSDTEWNYTYMLNNALGGSEKAVAYISQCFPKDYNIFISGHVKDETIDNIQYLHLDKLTNLINTTPFHTVIVSRYISFYEMFSNCSFYQSFIWAHDVLLLPYGCNLPDNQIIKKWNNYINGCVCLTEWHKNTFIEKYPELKDKIILINNGVHIEDFKQFNHVEKIKNKFIYSSRPDRGLDNLLNLWPQILEKLPDATLSIATYGQFPSNPQEISLKNTIDKYDNIHYLGKLNTTRLYEEMREAEYWLYPTHWPETSCITALEMLMSEVICLYYPVAGLPYTLDQYGIQVSQGNEIEKLVSLSEIKKCELRENGKSYAESCSWINRAKQWINKLLIKEPNNTKNIAIFNSFPFHYEMFGYIIDYCKKTSYKLTIFTNFKNNLGWLDFYKIIFNDYIFEYKNITEYNYLKDSFDITFVTTDDDYGFKNEWINEKCISIEHTCIIRRPEFKYKIATRPFITNYRDWALPCYKIFNETDKQNMLEPDINIAIIGGKNDYNYKLINRLQSVLKINLLIFSRYANSFDTQQITNNNITSIIYNNTNTIELFNLLKKCDYIFSDSTNNTDHINGISMSGNIPIAFSCLTPLIISKYNNALYNFKNVIEFDLESKDNINIDKGKININSLFEERKYLMTMLDSYLISNNFIENDKNTALIVDPRDDENLASLIHDFQEKLGDNWKIVFYCGKNLKNKMELILDKNIEVRELEVNNFNSLNEYSDFMKNKNLWNSLYGNFVLTFQLDAYILNNSPYTIDYFVSMNKSYIGGNIDHNWNELIRENIYSDYRNFNGGLSLRKRLDMIKIIDIFGTEITEYNSNKIQTDAEDVYFTLGCYKLNLPIGDNEECMHFCVNRILVDGYFGVHKPIPDLLKQSEEITKIYAIDNSPI
jgi:hypothetical protein